MFDSVFRSKSDWYDDLIHGIKDYNNENITINRIEHRHRSMSIWKRYSLQNALRVIENPELIQGETW